LRREWKVEPKISASLRSRCNKALSLINQNLHQGLKDALRKSLDAYSESRGRRLPPHTLARRWNNVPLGGGNDDLVADWVLGLPDLLPGFGVDASVVAEVVGILSTGENGTILATQIQRDTAAPASDGGTARSAMADLFGMQPSDYAVKTEPRIAGEYFGYRLSAHHGDIVRFYISVGSDPTRGLLKFTNLYRRQGRWTVEGFGFDVGQTTYLFGHAATKTGSVRAGRGLRLFALVPYSDFGWWTGPLISMDSKEDPIAARIILIPADHHSRYRNVTAEGRDKLLVEMIEQNVIASDLDREITFEIDDGLNPFDKIKCSLLIQAAIFNGTFTTLNARPYPLDRSTSKAHEQLFTFQKRAVELARDMQGSILPFFRIAAHGETILPIDNKRSEYLRDPSRDKSDEGHGD
jgi:hypothetical protein